MVRCSDIKVNMDPAISINACLLNISRVACHDLVMNKAIITHLDLLNYKLNPIYNQHRVYSCGAGRAGRRYHTYKND